MLLFHPELTFLTLFCREKSSVNSQDQDALMGLHRTAGPTCCLHGYSTVAVVSPCVAVICCIELRLMEYNLKNRYVTAARPKVGKQKKKMREKSRRGLSRNQQQGSTSPAQSAGGTPWYRLSFPTLSSCSPLTGVPRLRPIRCRGERGSNIQ